jgi:hypothetical protein
MVVDVQYKSLAIKIIQKFKSYIEKTLDVAKLHICTFAHLFWLNCCNILQEAKWLHKGM